MFLLIKQCMQLKKLVKLLVDNFQLTFAQHWETWVIYNVCWRKELASKTLSNHLVRLDGLKTLDLLVHVNSPAGLQVTLHFIFYVFYEICYCQSVRNGREWEIASFWPWIEFERLLCDDTSLGYLTNIGFRFLIYPNSPTSLTPLPFPAIHQGAPPLRAEWRSYTAPTGLFLLTLFLLVCFVYQIL